MDKVEDKPIVNWEDIATCTCGHFYNEHYFFEVLHIGKFKKHNVWYRGWPKEVVPFKEYKTIPSMIKIFYDFFINHHSWERRVGFCAICDCAKFKSTKPDYSDIIQKAEEQLEDKSDNCTRTCYPVGVLCRKFCEDLKLPEECFEYCKEIIKKARDEGWFQYFFGKNRISLAIALVYIADKTKAKTLITQQVYEELSGLRFVGTRKHIKKIRKFLEIPECKVVKG